MKRRIVVFQPGGKKLDNANAVQKGGANSSPWHAADVGRRLRMIKLWGNEKMGFRLMVVPYAKTQEDT